MKFSTCIKVGAGAYIGFTLMKALDRVLCITLAGISKCVEEVRNELKEESK